MGTTPLSKSSSNVGNSDSLWNKSTVLPASAIPLIVRVLSLVKIIFGVVMIGLLGGDASIFIYKISDLTDVLPVASLAITVKE